MCEFKDNALLYPLYIDCESCTNDGPFVYGPKNQLDTDLFQLYINSELLKKKNITIAQSMQIPFLHPEFYFLDDLCLYVNDNEYIYNRCNECQLIIPIDMNFYSNKTNIELQNEILSPSSGKLKDKYNLCKECCKHKTVNLHLVKISSGIDNISDWIHIFTINKTYDSGYNAKPYYNQFYCNLNVNSIHYNKFALMEYYDMLGDEFTIIEETCIEEILCEYNK